MQTKTRRLKLAAGLLALVLAIGCSQQSSDAGSGESDDDASPVAGKKMTSDIDRMCEEILQPSEIMEATDWLKRYPQSSFGEDEEGRPMLLSPVATRLREAGAQRIVVDYAKIGRGEFLVGMVVVLPGDTASRQRLFAMDAALSQLCEQTPVVDRGQKYLHYSFD
jgi:hypothetical protein